MHQRRLIAHKRLCRYELDHVRAPGHFRAPAFKFWQRRGPHEPLNSHAVELLHLLRDGLGRFDRGEASLVADLRGRRQLALHAVSLVLFVLLLVPLVALFIVQPGLVRPHTTASGRACAYGA